MANVNSQSQGRAAFSPDVSRARQSPSLGQHPTTSALLSY